MAVRVAVEDGLDNVRQALLEQGFEVARWRPGTSPNVDAAVVTGLSDNALGIEDTHGHRFPVIEASGRTVDEIVKVVRSRTVH